VNKKNSTLVNLFGLWALGLIVGANLKDILSVEASLHPGVMLAIGLVGSVLLFAAHYRAAR
jgi:hypothetical protein